MESWTTVEGYEVVKCTDGAVCLSKNGADTWVPRSVCMDGDALTEGDTDITVKSWYASRDGLDG